MERNFISKISTSVIQPFFRRLIGWGDLQEEVDTLRFILNHCIDITKAPKATGDLRKTQLAGAEFLRLFHEACEKHNIKYWLDYGTLLGAVRHSGYIPWDDDLDVSMTVEDLWRANEVLPQELSKYGVSFHKHNIKETSINIWDAGIICDIFTVDSAELHVGQNHNYAVIRKKLKKYNSFWLKNKSAPIEVIEKNREMLIGKRNYKTGVFYHTPESCYDDTVFENDTIFPLKKLIFEGYEFYVPNDFDKYLTEEFGDYMSFPKNGVLHHHGGKGDPIWMNAQKKGLDLDAFIEELKQIHIV